MRKSQELHINFLKLEDELDLFNRKIGGVLFWERLRSRMYFLIYFRVMGSLKKPMPSYSLLHRLRFYFTAMFNLVRNPFLTSRKDVIIVGHQRRLLGSDNRWWDIYTDTFIDQLDLSYAAIEESYYLEHRTPARTNGLRYFDVLDFLARARSFLGFTKIDMNEEERQFLNRLHKEILARFGVSINVRLIVKSMLKIRRAKLPLYIKLLRQIQPKLIVLVNSMSKANLIEACKILKIPIAELQHGVMNKYHPTYSYSRGRRSHTFPDYLLVWGDYWKTSAEYPIASDHIISSGFPYIEQELSKWKAVKKKKQILFISQGYVGEQISKLALALRERIGPEYSIVYKLHPGEIDDWKDLYPWLVGSEIDVIDQKESNIHKLFAESLAQVGVASTAVYEGLAYGLDTYVLDGDGAEYFDELAEQGLVQMISSTESLLNHFKKQEERKLMTPEYFFKKNSIKNIIGFIQSFLQANE
jgi:hypothetical protein